MSDIKENSNIDSGFNSEVNKNLKQVIVALTNIMLTSNTRFHFTYTDPKSDKVVILSNGIKDNYQADLNSDKIGFGNPTPAPDPKLTLRTDKNGKTITTGADTAKSEFKSDKKDYSNSMFKNTDSTDIKSDEDKEPLQVICPKTDLGKLMQDKPVKASAIESQSEIKSDKKDEEKSVVDNFESDTKIREIEPDYTNDLKINPTTGLNSVQERQLKDACQEAVLKMNSVFAFDKKAYVSGTTRQKNSIKMNYTKKRGFFKESEIKSEILKENANAPTIKSLIAGTGFKFSKVTTKKNRLYYLPAIGLNMLESSWNGLDTRNQKRRKLLIQATADFLQHQNMNNDDKLMKQVKEFKPNVAKFRDSFGEIKHIANQHGKVFNLDRSLYKKASAKAKTAAVNNLRHNCTDYDKGMKLVEQISDVNQAHIAFNNIVNKVFNAMNMNYPSLHTEINRQWKEHLERYNNSGKFVIEKN